MSHEPGNDMKTAISCTVPVLIEGGGVRGTFQLVMYTLLIVLRAEIHKHVVAERAYV